MERHPLGAAVWFGISTALLLVAAAQPLVTSDELAALSPAALSWVAADVERHTMETNGQDSNLVDIAVILARGSILVISPQRGIETMMPVPPSFGAASYIDARMSQSTAAGNVVFALLDCGAIVISRSVVATPSGRTYSPLGVIDGGFVELAYTADVCCAIRTDGAIQCFKVPSIDTAPMTAMGWRNVTSVLAPAPAALCGGLGAAKCLSNPGVPFRSISIAEGGGMGMTVCAIQISNNMPFCFGGNGYGVQLPDLQPAFLLPGLTGQPVAALQLMHSTKAGTHLWALTSSGANVAEWYDASGPVDKSSKFSSVGCVSYRCVSCPRCSTLVSTLS